MEIRRLGLVPYEEVRAEQRKLQQALIQREGAETVLLCEHLPVITLGHGAKRENLLCSEEELAARKIGVVTVERGGDVTFHGPGQLVVYPILDLRNRRRDVSWYLRTLEQIIVEVLTAFDVRGTCVSGRTGVWVPASDSGLPTRKIASIGVRLSRWCTMHGFALNVHGDLGGFKLINPCGLVGIEMTSIESETGSIPASEDFENTVISRLLAHLNQR